MNENDKKVKEYLEKENIPDEISPDNIRKMLDEKAPQTKRNNISVAGRIAAIAAACVVIVGGTVHVAGQKNLFNKKQNTPDTIESFDNHSENSSVTASVNGTENTTSKTIKAEEVIEAPYMAGAESYKQVYTMLKKSAEKYNKKYGSDRVYGPKTDSDIYYDDIAEEAEESVADYAMQDNSDDVVYNSAAADKAVGAVPQTSGIQSSAEMDTGAGDFSENNGLNGEFIAAPENPDEEPATVEEPSENPTEEITEEPTEEITEEPTEEITEEPTEEITEESAETTEITAVSTDISTGVTTTAVTTATTSTDVKGEDDFSDTYSQEENVREADIVKTDGKNIYYVYNDYNYGDYLSSYRQDTPTMNIVTVDNGKFINPHTLDLTPDMSRYGDDYSHSAGINNMYIYDDMLIVIGTVWTQYDRNYYYADGSGNSLDDSVWFGGTEECFVSFYTQDAEPKLIGTYFQNGYFNDVRISPDGYMYLVSNYFSADFDSIKNEEYTERYIPSCGTDDDVECIPPEDILLPKKFDEMNSISYTVIGGIDLTSPATFVPVDTKALAGYSGQFYMSENNIYTAIDDYSNDISSTEITRISVNQGNITPQASGAVTGYIKDQFSMSEYDGYFRVATTRRGTYKEGGIIRDIIGTSEYEYLNDNCVYVLDMDMNLVGYIDGLGENETIKSVNYNGNIAYVVTYRQTDPLYAIDLSDPANPTVMDEYKILGYSNYMQNWTDGFLFGFGADADENGVETGVKLVMFDNSDPYDIKEVGYYGINNDGETYLYSDAMWDRKALLIAPEKNIIGVPIHEYRYYYYDDVEDAEYEEDYMDGEISKYMFFSYGDGEFNLIGELKMAVGQNNLNRAIYIGKYVYALSDHTFISADIETLKETDRVEF
ncbi:MAG: beta-propeller domain-containing protein [Ruminococcus sp.]|nr:beta-propeller domain-containing protein [Ruminococcus sp.]